MDKNKQQTVSSGLYLVSTPIGNMEDITLRALHVLKKSDIILCEDTRRSGKLLSYFQIKNKLLPYHKFNEKKVSNKIVDYIKKNKVISLISDAGTPAISDPGMILVNKCIEENLIVYPIPGSSAVTSAVSVSGFCDQYLFYGFLTKKENELDKILISLCNLDYSIVFFIPSSKIVIKLFDSDVPLMLSYGVTSPPSTKRNESDTHEPREFQGHQNPPHLLVSRLLHRLRRQARYPLPLTWWAQANPLQPAHA